MKLVRRIVIEVEGKTDSDIEEAIAEAVSKVQSGCVQGSDSNDSGRYFFEVDNDPLPDLFTRAEKNAILHIASHALRDAETFDEVTEMLGLSDEFTLALRERLRKLEKKL